MPYATEKAIVALCGLVMYATAKDVNPEEVESRGIWAPSILRSNQDRQPA